MCGTILEISSDDEGLRRSCSTCRRRFDVRLTEDAGDGRRGLSLLYLADGGGATGETSTIGAGTTSFPLPSLGGPPSPEADGEPELPEEAHFKCACQALLAITRDRYEKRVRCPACRARMIVFLLFDSRAHGFTLQLFSLIDPTSGSTQVLTRL